MCTLTSVYQGKNMVDGMFHVEMSARTKELKAEMDSLKAKLAKCQEEFDKARQEEFRTAVKRFLEEFNIKTIEDLNEVAMKLRGMRPEIVKEAAREIRKTDTIESTKNDAGEQDATRYKKVGIGRDKQSTLQNRRFPTDFKRSNKGYLHHIDAENHLTKDEQPEKVSVADTSAVFRETLEMPTTVVPEAHPEPEHAPEKIETFFNDEADDESQSVEASDVNPDKTNVIPPIDDLREASEPDEDQHRMHEAEPSHMPVTDPEPVEHIKKSDNFDFDLDDNDDFDMNWDFGDEDEAPADESSYGDQSLEPSADTTTKAEEEPSVETIADRVNTDTIYDETYDLTVKIAGADLAGDPQGDSLRRKEPVARASKKLIQAALIATKEIDPAQDYAKAADLFAVNVKAGATVKERLAIAGEQITAMEQNISAKDTPLAAPLFDEFISFPDFVRARAMVLAAAEFKAFFG